VRGVEVSHTAGPTVPPGTSCGPMCVIAPDVRADGSYICLPVWAADPQREMTHSTRACARRYVKRRWIESLTEQVAESWPHVLSLRSLITAGGILLMAASGPSVAAEDARVGVFTWIELGLMAMAVVQPIVLPRSVFGTDRNGGTPRSMIPAVDTFTRGDDVVVRAELPGVDPEKDLDISFQDNVLKIHGERRREDRADEEGYQRFESSYGSFERTIPLPEGVNADDIKASYERGILEVVVPNAAKVSSPKKIAVTSGEDRRELSAASSNDG
jgi:HSP20 family protein